MSDRRQPWLKFYPTDWRGDPRLRVCSLSARGLWIECIAIMHEATPYGHLLVNGKAPDATQLGALVGAPVGDVQFFLNELEGAGVFSRSEDGSVFSRRMVADKKRAEVGQKHASDRWANRAPKGNPNGSPNGKPNAQKPEARVTEAKASGADAPDLKPMLFGQCLSWLSTATGKPSDRHRSTVGRWCKDHGDGNVLEAFMAARRENPVDPVAWITGALQRKGKHGRANDTPTRRDALAGAFADCFGEGEGGNPADQPKGAGGEAGADPGAVAATGKLPADGTVLSRISG